MGHGHCLNLLVEHETVIHDIPHIIIRRTVHLNLTPDTLLNIYQPEIILWLYAKSEPNKAFDFCFDDGILRQYFEFDKQYNSYLDGTADDYVRDIMNNNIFLAMTLLVS